jgi:uncharacterized protein (DUF58 family)
MDIQEREFTKKLKALTLRARHDYPGQKIGERLVKRSGGSVEFKDFKEYEPGDDIRFIDWNLWARLDKLFIKLFHNEENQHVSILLDCSRSMLYGNKWNYALQIAAAISYITLEQEDALHLNLFNRSLLPGYIEGSNPAHYSRIANALAEITPDQESNIEDSVELYSKSTLQKGMLFIISDFLYPDTQISTALKKLQWMGFETSMFQVLCDEEIMPSFQGPVELMDLETRKRMELSVTKELLLEYQKTCQEHLSTVEKLARKHGMHYALAMSSESFDHFILRQLAR